MNYDGLNNLKAEELHIKYGPNLITEQNKITPFTILLRQIRSNFVIYLLALSAIISFFISKIFTAVTILVIIVIIILTGFIQEYRAENAIRSLKGMINKTAIVIRSGKEIRISAENIVPDDIVILRSGDVVPADLVVLESKDLLLNESVLTGESREVVKSNDDKLYMGTHILQGKAIARVLSIGMNTEFGKIAKLISKAEKEISLINKVNVIAKYMSISGFIASVFIGLILVLRLDVINYPNLFEVLVVVIALTVSSFPEGFPLVLTATLARGSSTMAQKNAIVNRMSVIETLGETTVICSDKTGTITTGKMTAKNVWVYDKTLDVTGPGYSAKGSILFNGSKYQSESLNLLLKSSVLCNDAKVSEIVDDELKIIGSPTESALISLAAKNNIYSEDYNAQRIEEVPFSSSRKMMSVVISENKTNTVYSKGAIENILVNSSHILVDGLAKELDEQYKAKIAANAKNSASKGYRVIGFAYKDFDGDYKGVENNLTFIGFVSIYDSPRPYVRDAILDSIKAGISVKMITGDDGDTARNIAREIGLNDSMILGSEIDNLDDDSLARIIKDISIFARVRPDHKLRIVKALKARGEIVTMTGDGVNDAPALKEAHVGVAMGISGTEVSKESADLVLKDDNFSTIVFAIKEGRTIFRNIQKFTTYQIACNISSLFSIVVCTLMYLPLPLVAIQILFINLIIDDLSAVTLGYSPSSKNVMGSRHVGGPILTSNLIKLMFFCGIVMGAFTVASYYISYSILGHSESYSRTVAFISIILMQISTAFSFRSLKEQIHKVSITHNKYLFIASVISVIVTLTVIYTPAAILFELVPISVYMWIVPILFSVITTSLIDLVKTIYVRNNRSDFY